MSEAWPDLPYEAWEDTRDTLHLYTQVLGKLKLALCPPLNHWWHVALTLTPTGLTTGPVPWRDGVFDVELDFHDHRLVARHSDGGRRELDLRPRTVADFHAELMARLAELGITPEIHTLPSEIPDPIPFEQDTVHASYDPEYAARWWRVLLAVGRVMDRYRPPFRGKSSAINFYWGGFDLSVTRFTGRAIDPPTSGGRIMEYAEDEENFAVGFWPGSAEYRHPLLYAYIVPPPPGVADLPVAPSSARFEPDLAEFVLHYEDARAGDCDEAVPTFFRSAYEACAGLAGWDRTRLEGHVPDLDPAP